MCCPHFNEHISVTCDICECVKTDESGRNGTLKCQVLDRIGWMNSASLCHYYFLKTTYCIIKWIKKKKNPDKSYPLNSSKIVNIWRIQ